MAKGIMIIDGQRVAFDGEKNVLSVIRKAGIEMPTFCYYSDLSVYGACRMCVVEDERGKIDTSCSMEPRDGMVIRTNQAARGIPIADGTPVVQLISIGVEEYEAFTGGCLYLQLQLGSEVGAYVTKLDGMDVFVVEKDEEFAVCSISVIRYIYFERFRDNLLGFCHS